MPGVAETVSGIVDASTWDQRIARIRLIPQNHGTAEHVRIFAEVAREVYVPHLAADFAYIHEAPFYEQNYFEDVYVDAHVATNGFTDVSEGRLAEVLHESPRTLLVFRTILGLTKEEFAHCTVLAGEVVELRPLSAGKIDSMERKGTATTEEQAHVAANALTQVMNGTLFGDPAGGLKSKQDKPDTSNGWESVRVFATGGVPFSLFLHQRHPFPSLIESAPQRTVVRP